MQSHRMTFLFFLLISFAWCEQSHGQEITHTCAAFSPDGTLATGTVKPDEIEIRLTPSGAPVVTTQASITNSRNCEEKFSSDGKWLATVVPGAELTVVIHDSKTGSIHKQFSSAWRQQANRPIEWTYMSSFFGGFLPDDSFVLWRYVPRPVATTSDGSYVDLHLQRWSIEGEMLSEADLGEISSGASGRQLPTFANELGLLWLPARCRSTCYKEVRVSGAQIQKEGDVTLSDDNSCRPSQWHPAPGWVLERAVARHEI